MTSEVTQLIKLVGERGYHRLLLDLDETLTHLNLPWEEWEQQISELLPTRERKYFISTLSKPGVASGEILNELIRESQEFYKKFIEISLEFESRYFAHTPYQELLAALPDIKRRGCSLYLWSSNTRPTVERVLSELGIVTLFTRLVTREDTIFCKPHQEGWLLLRQPNEPLRYYLMVGDSLNDKLAAINADIDYFQIKHFKSNPLC